MLCLFYFRVVLARKLAAVLMAGGGHGHSHGGMSSGHSHSSHATDANCEDDEDALEETLVVPGDASPNGADCKDGHAINHDEHDDSDGDHSEHGHSHSGHGHSHGGHGHSHSGHGHSHGAASGKRGCWPFNRKSASASGASATKAPKKKKKVSNINVRAGKIPKHLDACESVPPLQEAKKKCGCGNPHSLHPCRR